MVLKEVSLYAVTASMHFPGAIRPSVLCIKSHGALFKLAIRFE